MLRIDDRVGLITGGGSGIGLATARRLFDAGAVVYVADLDLPAAQATCNRLDNPARAIPLRLDVTQPDDWQQALREITRQQGRFNLLVNNAGISISKPVAELSFEDWHKVLSVNVDGAFLGIKHALVSMSEGGSIVNVASVSGSKPFASAAAYCTSKAAVRMLTKAVAIECADAQNGIRVNLVSPAGVKTPMWEKEAFFRALIEETGSVDEAYTALAANRPSQAFREASDVANTILYLASDEARHVNGAEILLDHGHTL